MAHPVSNGMEIRFLSKNDGTFPALLREIPEAPAGVYLKGAAIGDETKIAIVGTRRASAQGRALAREFAAAFARSGVTVVSGLAMGIDTAAHEGACSEKGKTIAVLAQGLDRVYPRQNEKLAHSIMHLGGVLVSEYAQGTPSMPYHFLARNRIISGLCRAVVIIEAPVRSGALATAHFAVEQNRDVYVVPGAAKNALYEGSHKLIQEGAGLATSPEEVLSAMGIAPRAVERNAQSAGSSEAETVFGTLKAQSAPLGVDKLHDLTKISIPALNRVLTHLIIRGMIKEERGKYYL